MKPVKYFVLALPVVAAGLLATPAQAYIGPGVGLGVIGTVFGIVATLALAVFGFLWYPMKRLMAKRRGKAAQVSGTASAAGTTPATGTSAATEPATGPDALAPTSVRAPVADADVRRPHAEEA